MKSRLLAAMLALASLGGAQAAQAEEAGLTAIVADVLARNPSLRAGAKRVRPLLMTVLTNVFGLLPVLLDDGVGADVAKRIAAPMWGGLVSLTLLTLLVIPVMYVVWRSFELRRATPAAPPTAAPALAAAEEAAQG
ncbi:efflux RND transporter permease subunit [Sorangium sp. So ce448]|uniref:efflux RND transporter permease subunit n=1 Tax=Sorangium sp. So ce448 TaxID=3133314 RepID=UPI003F64672E